MDRRSSSGLKEWEETGVIAYVRLGMKTANECRRTVEDMIKRGGLVSVTASTVKCECGEDVVADIIMNPAQRNNGYLHEVGNRGLSDN